MTADSGQPELLPLALLIAAALHAMLIFGVSFEGQSAAPGQKQFEVTLLQTVSARAPRDAVHVAAENQEGKGAETLRELASRAGSPLPSGHPGGGESSPGEVRDGVRPNPLSNTSAHTFVALQTEAPQQRPTLQRQTDSELARLEARLQALESQLDRSGDASGRERIRRIDAVSAKSAADAAYLAAWRQRVESVGNRYYPEASLRYGIYGQLRLVVTVRSDGQLERVRVLESSGQSVLDEAALRIVRMAAPYPAFPADLRETTDRLEIVRTWQFKQNALSSNLSPQPVETK